MKTKEMNVPYLARDAGAGFRVEAELLDPEDFHPSSPVRVSVLAENGRVVLDQLTCDLNDMHEVVTHTAVFSEPYAEALR